MEQKDMRDIDKKDVLEKLQEFCKQNNLTIHEYKVFPPDRNDYHSPAGYQIVIYRRYCS